MRRYVLTLLMLLSLVLCGCSPSVITSKIPVRVVPPTEHVVEPVWEVEFDYVGGYPALSGDRVFVYLPDPQGELFLVAYDASNGDEVWRVAAIHELPEEGQVHGPAVWNGAVAYLRTAASGIDVVAVDPATGSERGSLKLGVTPTFSVCAGGVLCAVVHNADGTGEAYAWDDAGQRFVPAEVPLTQARGVRPLAGYLWLEAPEWADTASLFATDASAGEKWRRPYQDVFGYASRGMWPAARSASDGYSLLRFAHNVDDDQNVVDGAGLEIHLLNGDTGETVWKSEGALWCGDFICQGEVSAERDGGRWAWRYGAVTVSDIDASDGSIDWSRRIDDFALADEDPEGRELNVPSPWSAYRTGGEYRVLDHQTHEDRPLGASELLVCGSSAGEPNEALKARWQWSPCTLSGEVPAFSAASVASIGYRDFAMDDPDGRYVVLTPTGLSFYDIPVPAS